MKRLFLLTLFLLTLILQSCASPDRRELENHLTPEARAAGDTAALLDYLTSSAP